MGLYELNKNLEMPAQRGFIFNQINKLTIKSYSSLSNINIQYYLKFQIPMCLRQFFRIISQNPEYVERFRNIGKNPFHFSIGKWMINQY